MFKTNNNNNNNVFASPSVLMGRAHFIAERFAQCSSDTIGPTSALGLGPKNVVIASDALLEIVRRHFDMISPAQWDMLANGLWDVETKQTLLSLLIQLVQTLSANVFREVIAQRKVTGTCSILEETSTAFETITAVLSGSVAQVFAQALNVKALPDDVEQHSRELTVMLESEISQKVNRLLFIAPSGSQSPIMVDSSLSSLVIGRAMLHNTKHCLRALLAFFCCPSCKVIVYSGGMGEKSDSAVQQPRVSQCKSCFTSNAKLQFESMKESLSCKSVHAVMGAESCGAYSLSSLKVNFEVIQQDVDEMFKKLQVSVRSETVSNQSFQDFINGDQIGWFSKRLTNEIVREISEGIETMGQKEGTNVCYSPQPITVMVQAEVARYIQKLVNFMQEPPQNGFFNYDLFEKSMSHSRSSVSTPSTPPDALSPMSTPKKATPLIADLPMSCSRSSLSTPSTPSYPVSPMSTPKMATPPIADLFMSHSRSSLSTPSTPSYPVSPMSTPKMATPPIADLPMSHSRSSLSTPSTPSYPMSPMSTPKMATPSIADLPMSHSRSSLSTPSTPSYPVSPMSTPKVATPLIADLSMSHSRSSLSTPSTPSYPVSPMSTPKMATPSIANLSMSHSRSSLSTPSTPSYPVSPMSTPKTATPSIASSVDSAIDVHTPRSSTNSALTQTQTQYLITGLFMKLLRRELSLSPGDKGYRAAMERLTQKAWEEINIPENQAKATEKGLRKVIKAVMKDLVLEYSSSTRVLAKAIDPKDNTFEDNLVKYLKKHLGVFLTGQKKSAVAHFFSETWRIIKKPFCGFM